MEIKDFCTGVQHIGIPTKDIEETIRFYEQLGFTLTLKTKNGEKTVAFLQMHNLVMQIGAIDHIAIDVKNIDALFEEVKAKSFHLIDQKVNSLPFWENGIKYFNILGPNKEKIEFCEIL